MTQNSPKSRPLRPSWTSAIFSPWGEIWAAVSAGGLLLAGAGMSLADQPRASHALFWAALAIGLVHGVRAAWQALRAKSFDIDVLMALAAILAAAMGAPGEGALLLFLFVLAGGLEALAVARTTRAVEALHGLMPTRALREAAATGGRESWEQVEPEQLRPGDRIKILPGESVPADASVEQGEGDIDQASLTGESMPRVVRPGDHLYAGTINVGDPLIARVVRPAAESSLQRILNLVIQAQQQREPVQRLIDRLGQPYAIGVMLVSLAVFLVWLLALEQAWKDALYTAITLLIVMSPCAVVISTPTATLTGIARGARAGVLFKGGQAIERLARLRAVAFDKTGTLTIGRMRVRELHPVGWSDERGLLSVAAGLEQDSTHPIATAIRAAAEERAVSAATTAEPEFTPGRGVSARIDGAPARLGTFVFAEPLIPVCFRARVLEVLGSVQRQGQIATVVAHGDQAGVIILSDAVRPGANRLVSDLHALGVRPVVMLTGDNRHTAEAVARALHLDRFRAEMLPADKVAAVEDLKREVRGRPVPRDGSSTQEIGGAEGGVGVIGDGVNDAPALAAADVSIAIGSIGSDAALESADIVLLSDDLSVVPWAVALARRVRRTIALNLAFALGAIALMAAATLAGSAIGRPFPMWMGVFGHEGGTLLVVAHSLWILLFPLPGGVEIVKPEDRESITTAELVESSKSTRD